MSSTYRLQVHHMDSLAAKRQEEPDLLKSAYFLRAVPTLWQKRWPRPFCEKKAVLS